MPRTIGIAAALLLTAGLFAGCGSRTLDTPESLQIAVYPAGAAFTLTLLMKGCSDTCSTYEPATCTVEFTDGNVIALDVEVPYGDKDGADSSTLDGCSLQCGPPVYAHCPVSALGSGTWFVEAGTFRTSIQVK